MSDSNCNRMHPSRHKANLSRFQCLKNESYLCTRIRLLKEITSISKSSIIDESLPIPSTSPAMASPRGFRRATSASARPGPAWVVGGHAHHVAASPKTSSAGKATAITSAATATAAPWRKAPAVPATSGPSAAPLPLLLALFLEAGQLLLTELNLPRFAPHLLTPLVER